MSAVWYTLSSGRATFNVLKVASRFQIDDYWSPCSNINNYANIEVLYACMSMYSVTYVTSNTRVSLFPLVHWKDQGAWEWGYVQNLMCNGIWEDSVLGYDDPHWVMKIINQWFHLEKNDIYWAHIYNIVPYVHVHVCALQSQVHVHSY